MPGPVSRTAIEPVPPHRPTETPIGVYLLRSAVRIAEWWAGTLAALYVAHFVLGWLS